MTAELIARVVSDLRTRRVRRAAFGPSGLPPAVERRLEEAVIAVGADAPRASMFDLATAWAEKPGKVIDATTIYRRLVEQERPVWLYEDHPCISPPFQRFDVCYVNEHGNVISMCALAVDHYDDEGDGLAFDTTDTMDAAREFTQPDERWQPAESVDWDRVRWTIDTFLFVGGRGAGGPIPTTGPMHLWRFAVYEDGAPADLHWVKLTERPMEEWDMAHLVLLGALNFLACRNVVLVEHVPADRPARRRLARYGVGVHEIAVLPSGKTRRGVVAAPGEATGVPLTSVRGNFAEYGTNGKGLLFGKLAGRFWRPAHARGDAAHGESDAGYRLEASDA